MSGVVVFDLRYATSRYPGIGTYAAELGRALLGARPHWRWRVLMPHDTSRFDFDYVPEDVRVHGPEPAPLVEGFRLGRCLRRLGAALYHTPYLLRPWNAPCPTMLTLHDVIPLERPQDFAPHRLGAWRFLVADALRSDCVFTDSQASAAAIERAFVRRSAPVVLRPGAPRRPDDASQLNWPRPVVLTVGINKPHKNLETLVRAVAKLQPEERPLLVGAGPTDARWPTLDGLAALHGITGDVRVLGLVVEAALPGLYRSATVVAFPTASEGFGLPVLEAMSEGAPVLCSDIPVLREVGGDAVRYVPSGDVMGWSQALRALIADAPTRAVMGAAGRARAAMFTWARAAEVAIEQAERLVPALAGMR